MRVATFIFAFVLLTTPTIGHPEEKQLQNQDVVKMVKSGLTDAVIITIISNSPANFSTDVDSILELRQNGVDDEVIQAILKKSFGQPSSPPENEGNESVDESLPQDVGVYYRADSSKDLVPIEPEIVTWKTGGFWKSVATAGLNKGHINGVVRGARSHYVFKGDEEVAIYCLEGTSGTEYQLLRLWEKKDSREFRAVTGGIVHATGGADPNVVSFQPERVTGRIYTFKLMNMDPGEYGLLAPGAATAASAASVGKIYAFSVGR